MSLDRSETPAAEPSYQQPASAVSILPVVGIPEVSEGADIGQLIVQICTASAVAIDDTDVIVVTQKIVSKSEGRIVAVGTDDDSRRRVVEAESVRIVRRRGGLIISETTHGFVCANAGVDNSNVANGYVGLLPTDPDKSARRIRSRVEHLTGKRVAVIVSDTFGRAWRTGQVNVAIGVAGMSSMNDYVNTNDHFGQPLHVTTIAVADELASAAELVMGKADGVPVAIIKGARYKAGRGNAQELVRSPLDDLFR